MNIEAKSLSTNKKVFIHYALNAVVVLLTLFLAYRIFSPRYERKETVSVNKLGLFHTQLAAEKLGTRIRILREELKDNGLRLVDSARGPVNLDTSRWLWMRIQDRDWRAPNFLDPLPLTKSNIDTWEMSTANNSLVLSERVPIVRAGVQDFVVLEGGLRTSIWDDLQTDPNFGLWVFDQSAYKKGGLSVAKLFEKISASGALTKDEVKLLTSDLLGQLFQNSEFIPLKTEVPWSLSFKTSLATPSLGILGYWSPQIPIISLTSIWMSLAGALLLLSVLISFLSLKFTKPLATEQVTELESTLAKTPVAPPIPSLEAKEFPMAPPFQKTAFSLDAVLAWVAKGSQLVKEPLLSVQNSLEAIIRSGGLSTEVNEIILQARREIFKSRNLVERLSAFSGRSKVEFESLDLEIFFKEFEAANRDLAPVDSNFDSDLWRINTDAKDLAILVRCYIAFLQKKGSPEQRVNVAARFMKTTPGDVGIAEIQCAEEFKVPFVRMSFSMPMSAAGAKAMQATQDVEIPLSARIVERLHGRLKAKVGLGEGSIFILDIPAFEERRPEDKINAKQFDQELQAPTFRIRRPGEQPGEKSMSRELNPADYTIYIVEGDRTQRELLVSELRKLGFDAKAFHDGDSVLEEMKKGRLPHVLFADLQMTGLSGLGLAKRTKELSQEIEVVFMTSSHTMEFTQEALKLNIFDYLLKPYGNIESIRKVIFHVCRRIYSHLYVEYLETELIEKKAELSGITQLGVDLSEVTETGKNY